MAQANRSNVSMEDIQSSRIFHARGVNAFDSQQFDVALVFFKEAAKFDPENFNLYCLIAKTYAELGDFESALATTEIALDLCHGSVIPYCLKVKLLREIGLKDEAKIVAEAGITLDSDCEELRAFLESVRGVAKYVLTDEQITIVKAAFAPADEFFKLLKTNFQNSDDKDSTKEIFDTTIVQWKSKPSAEDVNILDRICVIWSGPGEPTEQTTQVWRKQKVEKNWPISCIMFFECNNFVVGKSRSFAFEACTDEIKRQIDWLEQDHDFLCDNIKAEMTCSDVAKAFDVYIKTRYENNHQVGDNGETQRKVQIPFVRKLGIGLKMKTVSRGKIINFRVPELSLNSNACSVPIKAGMAFCTNILLEYKQMIRRESVPYRIVYGDTVIVTKNGCTNLAKLSRTDSTPSTSNESTEPQPGSSNNILTNLRTAKPQNSKKSSHNRDQNANIVLASVSQDAEENIDVQPHSSSETPNDTQENLSNISFSPHNDREETGSMIRQRPREISQGESEAINSTDNNLADMMDMVVGGNGEQEVHMDPIPDPIEPSIQFTVHRKAKMD